MTKLEDLEKAIARLALGELERFRAWSEEFQAARFDEKIARDVQSGKFDRLAEAASNDFPKSSHLSIMN